MFEGGDDQIVIETLVSNQTLYIEIRSDFASETGKSVSEYRISLADGRPVPDWISVDNRGFVLVESAVDLEELDLKVTAVLDDGSSITQTVQIQAVTGEIEAGRSNPDNRAALFSEQIDIAHSAQDLEAQHLTRILAG